MTEYQIQPSSRRCVITGRELQPGEKYYTVLLEENDRFTRQDFSHEAWSGPPPNTFSFWMGRIPQQTGERRLHIDDELLADCFHRLENQTEPRKLNFRYVVALLLMRHKRFKFEDVRNEGGQEILVLRCTRDKKKYEVINPHLSEEEIEAVQEEVFKVLGWA